MNPDTIYEIQSASNESDRRYSPTREMYVNAHTPVSIMSTSAVMNPAPSYTKSHDLPSSSQPYRAPAPSSQPPRRVPDLPTSVQAHHPESRRSSNEAREHTRLPSIKETFGPPPERSSSTTYTYTSAPSVHSYAYSNTSTTPTSRTFPSEPSPFQPRYGADFYNHPPPSITGPTERYESRLPQIPAIDAARQQIALSGNPPTHSPMDDRDPLSRRDIDTRRHEKADQFSKHSSPTIEQYRGYPVAPPGSTSVQSSHERAQFASIERRVDPWGSQQAAPHGVPYEMTLKRNLDVWDVEQNLSSIRDASSRLAQISADAFNHIQRYSRSPTSEGNPSLQTCDAMLHDAERIRSNLIAMREALMEQDRYLVEQQQRRDSGRDREYLREEAENLQYEPREMHSDRHNGLKRRGRAAPPGRCHSCQRAETPEWRRGPDGARTLCNACGLHYAKLTRKTANEKNKNINAQPPGSSS